MDINSAKKLLGGLQHFTPGATFFGENLDDCLALLDTDKIDGQIVQTLVNFSNAYTRNNEKQMDKALNDMFLIARDFAYVAYNYGYSAGQGFDKSQIKTIVTSVGAKIIDITDGTEDLS